MKLPGEKMILELTRQTASAAQRASKAGARSRTSMVPSTTPGPSNETTNEAVLMRTVYRSLGLTRSHRQPHAGRAG